MKTPALSLSITRKCRGNASWLRNAQKCAASFLVPLHHQFRCPRCPLPPPHSGSTPRPSSLPDHSSSSQLSPFSWFVSKHPLMFRIGREAGAEARSQGLLAIQNAHVIRVLRKAWKHKTMRKNDGACPFPPSILYLFFHGETLLLIGGGGA